MGSFVTVFLNRWKFLLNRLCLKGFEDDPFAFVDIISIIGGIYYKSENAWKQRVWKIYRIFASIHFLIPLLYSIENVLKDTDIVSLIWCGIVICVGLSICVNEIILRRSYKTLLEIRKFINDKSNATSEPQFDSSIRNVFSQISQIASLTVIAMIIVDEILSPVVAMHEDRYFGLPRFLSTSSSIANGMTRFVYLVVFIPIWISKVFNATVEITALIVGCRSELKIFTKGFEEFLDDTREQADTLPREVFWKFFKIKLRFQIELHVSLVNTQRMVNELLSQFFMVTYYRDVIVIGSMIFIILSEGFSARSGVIVLSILTFFAECWWLSMLSEFFDDSTETIEELMDDLMVTIPYSKENHSDYQQLRTTLTVIKMNAHECTSVKYAGVFFISIETFSQLVDISYSVLTFLLNIGV
ncbi:AAEL017296-PA [Aedes aegypti]|uniref:Odorant receptor 93 n=2 Tax=Aedes aegypti TaxID=7159 RepID=J9E8X8_AEDAE|nr:AAEL017296-PA [Aedes aegypti]DAA80424.1 TPA_exp: odorant receptor 93 [Aedes aegypti]